MTEEEKKWYYEWPRPEMQPYVPGTTRTMLEVGCAHGAFSAAVRDGIQERLTENERAVLIETPEMM